MYCGEWPFENASGEMSRWVLSRLSKIVAVSKETGGGQVLPKHWRLEVVLRWHVNKTEL